MTSQIGLRASTPRLLTFVFPILAPFARKHSADVLPLHTEMCKLPPTAVSARAFQSRKHQRADLQHGCYRYPEKRVLGWTDRRVVQTSRQLASSSSEDPKETDAEAEHAIRIISTVMGERGSAAFEARRELATAQQEGLVKKGMAKRQLVYGELQLDRFIMLMEAAGVREMAKTTHKMLNFLDIGSGDGQLVFAAALVYPELLGVCRGVEVVDGLVARSQDFDRAVRDLAAGKGVPMGRCELLLRDIYCESADVRQIIAATDIAVCFATTWDHDSLRRGYVPGLSQALAQDMRAGSKVLMVDKKLCEEHGWSSGSLDFENADVAPYSSAHLYLRK